MFEATIKQGSTLKKIVESIKDLVTDANLECSPSGISLQAMDASHVSLVSLKLNKEGFAHFRADRNISLGVNMNNLSKILKCAANDDKITMKADDDGDVVSWIFEGEASERVSDFELKLMEIDTEHLGIPETEYTCKVKLPSGEFQRIIRDISTLGDTCTIAVAKDSVKFSVKGDIGTGHITRKHVPEKGGDGDKKGAEADYTVIEMDVPCEQTFAIRYLGFFIKATSLSSSVTLHLSADVPLLVEYKVDEIGTMRFYLAPKIEDESA